MNAIAAPAIRLLHPRSLRRVAVPSDGMPLTDAEMRAFVDVLRGWRMSAPDPYCAKSPGGHR